MAACLAVLLVAGCTSDAQCGDPCPPPGALVNVELRWSRAPFTITACVVGVDVPCTEVTYEDCRPGESCANSLDHGAPPGASRPHWVPLSTIVLDLGDLDPRDLDGETVRVTVQGIDTLSRSARLTATAQLEYFVGGACCDAGVAAELRMRFPHDVRGRA